MKNKLLFLFFLSAILFTEPRFSGAAEQLLVADFERWPNPLGGDIGVYGGGEPDWGDPLHSWFYEPQTSGYLSRNVRSGVKSFRLVNAQKPNRATWASLTIDLGPTFDITVEPKRLKSLDVSAFTHLAFWVRGERGGEKFEVAFRDARSPSYQHEVTWTPFPDGVPSDWSLVKVPLSKFKGKLDLTRLDMVGLHFGQNLGNPKGAILYVDDFVFVKD